MLFSDLKKLDGMNFIHRSAGFIFKFNFDKISITKTNSFAIDKKILLKADAKDIIWAHSLSSVHSGLLNSIIYKNQTIYFGHSNLANANEFTLNESIKLFCADDFALIWARFNKFASIYHENQFKKNLMINHKQGFIAKTTNENKTDFIIWMNVVNEYYDFFCQQVSRKNLSYDNRINSKNWEPLKNFHFNRIYSSIKKISIPFS